jgi:NAD(P)-dependent dehydrogenase (short-subunit alcohol dehydrogenase family)
MASLKVSEFDAADPLDGTETFGFVQGTENRRDDLDSIAAYIAAFVTGGGATLELIRDTIGTALTEGGGVDIIINDAGDTITLTTIEMSDAEGWEGDDTFKVLTARRLYTLAAEQALTDGATITPDFDTGINFSVTLGGNRTLANPTNAKSGQSGLIFITQDGTGSRTLAYGANWLFPGGDPTLSTAAGSIDVISYIVRANGTIAASIAKALS